jgi:hypothetical protein
MCHGFSAVKEMDLNTFAEYFTSNLLMSCLVFDHRGFGESNAKQGQPRLEIIPSQQTSDISDAITYAQSRPDVQADKIGIWGSSFSGGHALWVGATDKRVKAVLSQVPCVDGYSNFQRLIRPDFVGSMNVLFQKGREFTIMPNGLCSLSSLKISRPIGSRFWESSCNVASHRFQPSESICVTHAR